MIARQVVVHRIAWAFVFLSGAWGLFSLHVDLYLASTAPQQAAAAAMSTAYVVIPYVIARALDELWKADAK